MTLLITCLCSTPLALSTATATTPSAAPHVSGQRVALATGVTLHVVERGDPSGEPVLFLHGFSDTVRSWSGTLDVLEALRPDLRLFAVDLRGHGASTSPAREACASAPQACLRVVDLAADALAFLDAYGIEAAHVVGHSLGSFAAQALALAHPQRVQSLTLIGTAARTAGNAVVERDLRDGLLAGWRAALARRVPEIAWPAGALELTPLDVDRDMQAWMLEHWVVEPLADPALLAAIAADTVRIPLGTWIGVVTALTSFDHRAQLADLAVPTLVVWGSADEICSLSDQLEVRAALAIASERHGTRWYWKRYGAPPASDDAPAAELAHNLQWAAPEAVAADLAAFLRDGGAPTHDLPSADPAGRVVLVRGAAEVIAR